jgi:hypothetical protein
MSPRRAPHMPRLGFAVAFLALFLSGCIFNPQEKPKEGPPPPGPPISNEELIQRLVFAYQNRDYDGFVNLFPNTDDNILGSPYLFILSEALPNGQTNWDLTEELRIHRRMFQPENTLPGETPVPPELWLSSITISLTPKGAFAERPDLYKSPANPDGLDSNVWKAQEAQYTADLLFDTQGPNDFRVNGNANFVVIENLTKASGDDRKFLIYRWEDLGASGKPVATAANAVPAL